MQFVYPHRVCYSQQYTAFLIAAIIPVTTAENGRSFSCMKHVKTYLRSVINDYRLGDLATLSINREKSYGINMEDIVDYFAKLANRRIALLKLQLTPLNWDTFVSDSLSRLNEVCPNYPKFFSINLYGDDFIPREMSQLSGFPD